jgi:hypothetical protein
MKAGIWKPRGLKTGMLRGSSPIYSGKEDAK